MKLWTIILLVVLFVSGCVVVTLGCFDNRVFSEIEYDNVKTWETSTTYWENIETEEIVVENIILEEIEVKPIEVKPIE